MPAAARVDGAVWGVEWGGAGVRSDPAVELGSLYVTRPTLKDYVRTREELEKRAAEVFGLC